MKYLTLEDLRSLVPMGTEVKIYIDEYASNNNLRGLYHESALGNMSLVSFDANSERKVEQIDVEDGILIIYLE